MSTNALLDNRYLGDWIARRKARQGEGREGADERLRDAHPLRALERADRV